MGILDKLFGGKKNSEILSDEEILNAGACPNCWGRQEYDTRFVEYVKDQTMSNINNEREHQKAFIQQFVETNITGIRLKKDDQHLYCTKCKSKY